MNDEALVEQVISSVLEVAAWEKNHGNVYMDGSHQLKASTVSKGKQAANDIISLIRRHDEPDGDMTLAYMLGQSRGKDKTITD